MYVTAPTGADIMTGKTKTTSTIAQTKEGGGGNSKDGNDNNNDNDDNAEEEDEEEKTDDDSKDDDDDGDDSDRDAKATGNINVKGTTGNDYKGDRLIHDGNGKSKNPPNLDYPPALTHLSGDTTYESPAGRDAPAKNLFAVTPYEFTLPHADHIAILFQLFNAGEHTSADELEKIL